MRRRHEQEQYEVRTGAAGSATILERPITSAIVVRDGGVAEDRFRQIQTDQGLFVAALESSQIDAHHMIILVWWRADTVWISRSALNERMWMSLHPMMDRSPNY
jgi:hypothetical protein